MTINHGDQAASLRKASQPPSGFHSKKAVCCLAVASGKGGVGKTFISVNLAIAFSQMNKKVLLVDADLGLANADIIFGVTPKHSLQDAVFKGKDLKDVVISTNYGVDLLAASSGSREMVSLGQARMGMLINNLIRFASEYDVLIFDCAAGIESNVMSFLSAAPQGVVVMTNQPTSMMDVYALIKLVHQEGSVMKLGLIVNMVDDDAQGRRIVATLSQVTQRFLSSSVNLLGIIPRSREVEMAIRTRKPLLISRGDDDVSRRLKEIAKSILQKRTAVTQMENLDGSKLMNGLLTV